MRMTNSELDDHHATRWRLPQPHVPARHGRHAGAAAARRDGAGVLRHGEDGRQPVRRLGFIYVPERRGDELHRHELLDAEGRRRPTSSCRRSWRRSRRSRTDDRRQRARPSTQAERSEDGANGDHTRGTSTWLTGVHRKHTEGADVDNGITADQIAAPRARQGHAAAVARAEPSTSTIWSATARTATAAST